jgi:hypothetical protein
LTFGIFEEIERLIKYIPLDTDSPIDGKFAKGVSIDSHFFFHDADGVAIRLGVSNPGPMLLALGKLSSYLTNF